MDRANVAGDVKGMEGGLWGRRHNTEEGNDMQVVEFDTARRFKMAREKAGIREYSFKNTYELVEFVANEIRTSKIKYSKLAKRADVCPATVSNIASRVTMAPRVSTVLNILKALGFEVMVRG